MIKIKELYNCKLSDKVDSHPYVNRVSIVLNMREIYNMPNTNYEELAIEAIKRVQLLPKLGPNNSATLMRLLADDSWWTSLSGAVHKQIGRYISNNSDRLIEELKRKNIDIRYRWYKDEKNHIAFKHIEEKKEYKYIYHYTCIAGFLGIITSGCIRLMNSRYTNDRSEINFFAEKVFSIVTDETGDENAVKKFREEYFEKYGNEPYYFASFSNLVDDASQWERYADGGRGVCIAFNLEEFQRLVKSLKYGNYQLDKIYYHVPLGKNAVITNIENYVNNSSKLSKDKIFEKIFEQSPWYKHESFKQEQEYRLLTRDIYGNGIDLRKREVSGDGRSLREFIEFYFDGNARNPINHDRIDISYPNFSQIIDQVIIGPACLCPAEILKRKLGDDGISINIKESNCPLR